MYAVMTNLCVGVEWILLIYIGSGRLEQKFLQIGRTCLLAKTISVCMTASHQITIVVQEVL